MPLSEAGLRRLVHYCRRAAIEPPEYVHRPDVMPLSGGRNVRYLPQHLRQIIWHDTEVRDAVLTTNFDDLANQIPRENPFGLLDIFSAVSLEARQARPTA